MADGDILAGYPAGLERATRLGAIVLCGGRSTRMGSPKALLPFGPETMLQRVVRLLGTAASPIVVVAAPNQQLPPLPDSVILTTDERETRGPLEGLRAGLKALPADVSLAYVTSCDVPLLVPSFVSRMRELLGEHDAVAMKVDDRWQPLAAVYRRAVLPHVDVLLAADRLRATLLLETVRTRAVSAMEMADVDPTLDSLRNVNTRDDYVAALERAGITAIRSGPA